MDQKMFCYQCEQTAGCAGCTGNAGVCGKTAETSRLQDQLVGALVGLARAAEGVECPGDGMYRTVIEGLFTTLTNVSFDDDAIRAQIEKTHREKEKLLAAPVRRKAEEKTPAAGTDPAAGNESGEQAADDYNLGSLMGHGSGYPFLKIPDSVWLKGNGGICVPCADARGV